MRPRLPKEIEHMLPIDIVRLIYTYVPHNEKPIIKEISPSLQKELIKIQSIVLKGKSATYMKDLDDVCLD